MTRGGNKKVPNTPIASPEAMSLTSSASSGGANANAEPNPSTAASTSTYPTVSTEDLLQHISAAVAGEGKLIMSSVSESIGKLESKVDSMVKCIEDTAAATERLVARMTEAETRISGLEDSIDPIQTRLQALEKSNQALKEKVTDLECRQRRKNIRLLHLKESTEGDDPLGFFEAFIPKLLKLPIPTISIDRAHRGFGAPVEGRPRPVVLKLHRSSEVAMVMTAARRRENLQHDGQSLRIVPDVPPEVRAARRAFNPVCAELIKRNIRFRMAHPAVLSFKANGIQKTFRDPNEAGTFLSTLAKTC